MNKPTKTILMRASALLLTLSLAACGGGDAPPAHDHAHDPVHAHDHGHGHADDPHHPPAMAPAAVRVAIAELKPTEGSSVRGTVTFTREEDGIRVVADLTGFAEGPRQRGFHIHEHGDCSAPDGMSAGGHFNPHGAEHGAREGTERHVGDFGNIEVGEDGTARKEFVDHLIEFDGDASIIGRSVIVHAQEDDLTSQPTGDAGGRVACGVIRVLSYVNDTR